MSENGQTWEQIEGTSTVAINMLGDVYIGLVVTSHAGSHEPCTAVFSNLSAEGVSGLPLSTIEDIGLPINSPANLYVRLEDSGGTQGIVNHLDDPNAVLADEWAEWRIDLSQFSGQNVDLTQVQKMTIGIGDAQPDGMGKLYIDDIRLTKPAPEPIP